MKRGAFDQLSAELWLAQRLPLPTLFDGITTTADRRERIRRELLNRGIADQVVGRRDGKPQDWASLFLAIYGEHLVQGFAF